MPRVPAPRAVRLARRRRTRRVCRRVPVRGSSTRDCHPLSSEAAARLPVTLPPPAQPCVGCASGTGRTATVADPPCSPRRELRRGRARALPRRPAGPGRDRRGRRAPRLGLRRADRAQRRARRRTGRPRRRPRRRRHDADRQPARVGAGDARLLPDRRRRAALQHAAAPRDLAHRVAASPSPVSRSARRRCSASCPTASRPWTSTSSRGSSTRSAPRRPCAEPADLAPATRR